MRKTVTVFGSSVPRVGSPEYEDAFKLASILASKGFNICSGGYRGIMDAVSKGARENGSEAIGVTIKNRDAFKSNYVTKEIVCDTLFERLAKLIETGDGYIVLGGGTGTMLELSAIWELMNKGIISVKPAACLSKMWEDIVRIMDIQIAREGRETGLIKTFQSIEDAAGYIIKILSV